MHKSPSTFMLVHPNAAGLASRIGARDASRGPRCRLTVTRSRGGVSARLRTTWNNWLRGYNLATLTRWRWQARVCIGFRCLS